MKRLAVVGGVLVFLLSACGSPATPEPTNEAESTAEATTFVAIDAGRVSFEVSGDVTLTANAARATYQYLGTVERQQLLIQDAGGTYLLLFILPKEPQTGAHALEASGREYQEDGVYVTAFTESLAEEAAMFSAGIDGTITLDAVGDRISGSFNFNAENANGQHITISGTFASLPLIFG